MTDAHVQRMIRELDTPATRQYRTGAQPMPGGACVLYTLPNGHWVSVARHGNSYGRQSDNFEIRVADLVGEAVEIPDLTDANGIAGWLTASAVEAALLRILALPVLAQPCCRR